VRRLALLALPLALAGCGTTSTKANTEANPLSPFVLHARAVCEEARNKENAVAPSGRVTSKTFAKLGPKLLAIEETRATKLLSLHPPAKTRAAYAKFLREMDRALAARRRAVAATTHGRRLVARGDLGDAADAARNAARAAGIDGCP
jgi:hypothetical protein